MYELESERVAERSASIRNLMCALYKLHPNDLRAMKSHIAFLAPNIANTYDCLHANECFGTDYHCKKACECLVMSS